jgi:hypothetical protein
MGQRLVRRRRRAAVRACFASDFFDAARFGSRFKARSVARERDADGFLRVPRWPAR